MQCLLDYSSVSKYNYKQTNKQKNLVNLNFSEKYCTETMCMFQYNEVRRMKKVKGRVRVRNRYESMPSYQ